MNIPSTTEGSEQGLPAEPIQVYPPKFTKPQPDRAQAWLRSATSLALYLIVGFYFFRSLEMILLITAIVILHEMGHFIAMKAFRYNDLGIFFIPLLGAYVSGTKREVSQRESAIILLAGPVPGMIIGLIFYFLYQGNNELAFGYLSFRTIGLAFLFLNLLNLLPVYPLDGGQLLNRVFFDEESWLSKGFQWLSILALIWAALFAFSQPMYILLIFPAMLLLRQFGDSKAQTVERRIEEHGLDLNYSYTDLPDETYWKARNILIAEHSGFSDVPPTPPYSYHPKEEKIMGFIESLLHRHLIQDMNLAAKIFLFLFWLAALSCPWWLSVDTDYLARLGINI